MKKTSTLAVALLAFGVAWDCGAASSGDVCQGHQLLPKPRPAASCKDVKAQTFKSPDGLLTASVFPVNPILHASPDMESRVDILASDAHALASKDYASPRGTDGYHVVQAKWTSDSQFFVFTISSSSGHSPWSFLMAVYSRERNTFFKFSDMIQCNPTISASFKLKHDHTVIATTWRNGNFEKPMSVTVNLKDAVTKLPVEDVNLGLRACGQQSVALPASSA